MTDIQRRRFLTAGVLAAAGARSIGAEAQLARTERMEAPSSPAAPTNEPKKKLWMLLASQKNAQLHLVAPTIAWIADQAGVAFENYFEAHGNGDLFGSSTVVGGHHHQQFNYLNTLFDIDYILLGPVNVFRSSIEVFRRPVLVESDNLLTIYDSLLAAAGIRKVEGALFATTKPVTLAKHKPESGVLFKRPDNRPQGEVPLNDPLYRSLAQVAPPSKGEVELQPYLYPDIYFGKLLGLPADSAAECPALFQKYGIAKTTSLYLRPEEKEKVVAHFPNVTEEDTIRDDDTHASISLRRANRWKSQAKGVVWADSAMMASLYARVCREKRVPFFEREFDNHPAIGSFRGRMSHAIDAASKFACELGNKVIVGRGVWDGDIIWMSQSGCCIQIMDPRRPVFPILETVYHPWTKTGRSVFDDEPSDGQLERWASEGKVLTSLIWHSGEVAHNEGVVNLLDLAAFRGLKMGIGVHLARYQTMPQFWEQINIPRERGGVKGYIEPVLHSGGMGVMAERYCPAEDLRNHIQTSLAGIQQITGGEAVPKGYYAFLDTSSGYTTQDQPKWDAAADNGLEYFISSALYGKNRVLCQKGRFTVINQTLAKGKDDGFSPFLRFITEAHIAEPSSPGWLLGAKDTPVVAFTPHVWAEGATKFMKIVERLTQGNCVNVTPHVIARYATLLKKKGVLEG